MALAVHLYRSILVCKQPFCSCCSRSIKFNAWMLKGCAAGVKQHQSEYRSVDAIGRFHRYVLVRLAGEFSLVACLSIKDHLGITLPIRGVHGTQSELFFDRWILKVKVAIAGAFSLQQTVFSDLNECHLLDANSNADSRKCPLLRLQLIVRRLVANALR